MTAYNQTSIEVIDLPDLTRTPDAMPKPFDSMSLAHSLGIRNRTLMHLVVRRQSMYKIHSIPKKSGGRRTIHAPERMLKFVQTRVLKRYLTPLTYPDHVAAYVQGRTTRDSAMVHAGKPILIVLDLKDFFTSTRRSWVRRAIQDEFGYGHRVASLLADLMTVPMDFPYGKRYVVPQGAPTSGAICNWVAHHRIDKKILELCERWGMAYTRYADDLAFSSKARLDRKKTNLFIKAIVKIIRASGYSINKKKLRVARSGRQQRLLGMTINEKPNIMRLHFRKMRARIHHCKYDGFAAVAKTMNLESPEKLKSQIEGQISYYHMINPVKAQQLRTQYEAACAAQNEVPVQIKKTALAAE
jgi:RNA-directed DNA polymerase